MSNMSYSAIMSERNQTGRRPTTETGAQPKFAISSLNFFYGPKQALYDISLSIPE